MGFLALLPEILAGILEALGGLATINSVVQFMRSILNPNDPNSAFTQLANTVTSVNNDVESPIYGLAHLQTTLDGLVAQMTALGSPQQTGVAVTLPAAPGGYGGAPVGETADAVWLAILPTCGQSADWALSNVFLSHLVSDGYEAKLWHFGEYFTFNTDPLNFNTFGLNGGFFPHLDYSLLTAEMGVHDWLIASMPAQGWVLDFATDHYQWHATSPAICTITCTIGPGELYAIKQGLGLISPSLAAPIWPGLDKVTLGDPVDLSGDAEVPGPMDGLLVAISAWPAGKSTLTYGSKTSILRIGALTFITDNGDAEFVQALSLDNEVYCPKVMTQAASAIIRAAAGVEGTATPWVAIA